MAESALRSSSAREVRELIAALAWLACSGGGDASLAPAAQHFQQKLAPLLEPMHRVLEADLRAAFPVPHPMGQHEGLE